LNILLRKDNALSNELTQKIEAIIDDLMVITPSMMERYPGDTLTYEIKKIGKTHLFKTVKEYLDLSLESRKNQLDIFKKTIESLHDVSNRSRDIVEKNETAEFKTMANFLAGKFS
jgi:3',5'-cyclic AMP phosphodiesterase CpdA